MVITTVSRTYRTRATAKHFFKSLSHSRRCPLPLFLKILLPTSAIRFSPVLTVSGDWRAGWGLGIVTCSAPTCSVRRERLATRGSPWLMTTACLSHVGKHSSLWHSTWWKQTHRHTDTHRDNSNSNSKTLFYKDCSLGSERVSKEESWCFTPSQQVRLYQGDRETETRV